MTLAERNILSDIKAIIEQSRTSVARAVNVAMVVAYWKIGERIVREEQKGKKKAGYGEGIIKELSAALSKEYGNGFSATNLKYFRQFYLTFPIHHEVNDKSSRKAIGHAVSDQSDDLPIRHALRGELSWTHYRLLMKVENEQARNYYINEAIEQNWSTRTLERQINSLYYERILSSKNRKALKVKTAKEAKKAMCWIL